MNVCMSLKSVYQEKFTEAGCDEAGRGCLAGPVFAAAVILPPDYYNPALNDSKKIAEKTRFKLRQEIEKDAIAWAVASCSPEEIDEMNILRASILAMHRAIAKLKKAPGFILVDGNRFQPFNNIPYKCFVKGDGRFASIAAASILAKTYRDDFMTLIAKEFPQYQWSKNKGYPTRVHREAIKKFGATIWHRKSFRLLNEQLVLEF